MRAFGRRGVEEAGGRSASVLGDIACSLAAAVVLAGTSFGSLATVGVREYAVLADPSKGAAIIAGVTAAVFLVVACACYALLRNAGRIISWAEGRNPLRALPLSFGRRGVAIAAAVIFVCWLPYVVVQFPVAMNDDTYNQLYQFQTSAPTYYTTIGTTVPESYIDHHPVLDTLLYGVFLSLGDALGSQNAGLFAFSLLQSALMAIALGTLTCYLERLGVPKLFRVASLAFFALFPPLPLWAATMVKDVTNALFFVPFALLVAEAVRSRGALLGRPGIAVSLAVVACLCTLTKKSGTVVVVASLAALAVHLGGKRATLSAVLASTLVACFVAVPLAVNPLIGGVAPAASRRRSGSRSSRWSRS